MFGIPNLKPKPKIICQMRGIGLLGGVKMESVNCTCGYRRFFIGIDGVKYCERCLRPVLKVGGMLGISWRNWNNMITNGEVRQKVYEGDGKGVFKWVFAGNAHSEFSEGVLRDMAAMRLGNFEYIVQATRRNKIKKKTKGEVEEVK